MEEREVLRVLVQLAGACRELRRQLSLAQPVLERLGEDYPPALGLVSAVAVALADGHAPRGTPTDLERRALDALRDLDPAHRRQ